MTIIEIDYRDYATSVYCIMTDLSRLRSFISVVVCSFCFQCATKCPCLVSGN